MPVSARVFRRVAAIVCRPSRRLVALFAATAALAFPRAEVRAQGHIRVIARDTGLVAKSMLIGGLNTFELALEGKQRRDLSVHRKPLGQTVQEVMRRAAGRPNEWFEQWSFGGPAVPPDTLRGSSAFLYLRPGQYLLVSYELDSAGRPRGGKPFYRELTVIRTATLISPRMPSPYITVKAKDARIEVTGGSRAGNRTIQIDNAGGRAHEVVIGRLKPGKTAADVGRWRRDSNAEPPFVYLGGATPMSGGNSLQVTLPLQAGEHVALCVMRDASGRGYHYQSGAIASFHVK